LELRYGILCNGYHFQKWQSEALRLLNANGIKPVLLIVDDNPEERLPFLKKLWQYPYKNMLFRLYARFGPQPDAKQTVDLSSNFSEVNVLRCKTIQKGYSEYFSEKDIKTINDFHLDFIIRFGFDIIKGEILNAAKYGIWSYHHDDELKYRGAPSCFWEIYENDPINGAILQRLTSRLDGGIILKKGWFDIINHSWAANTSQLLSGTAEWILQVCNDIKNGKTEYFEARESSSKVPLRFVPGNFTMLLFLCKILKNKILFHYRELFRSEIWNVGYIKMPVQKFVESKLNGEDLPVQWLPKVKSGTYLADVFAYEKNDNEQLLCEWYDYRKRKAFISGFPLSKPQWEKGIPPSAIHELHHQSFPFVFEYDGNLFCLPESYESGELKLYRFDKENERFTFFKTLLNKVEAVDPILFEYERHWWLLFTSRHSSNIKLYAWYAQNPLEKFSPHTNNPVKTDVRSTRCAGTPFEWNGILVRPAQNCSDTYGSRICLNKIEKLNPLEFHETTVGYLEPSPDTPYHKGLHTLSSTQNFTFIDGKQYKFVWSNFLFQLRRKIGLKE